VEVFRIFGSIFLQGNKEVTQGLKEVDAEGQKTANRMGNIGDGAILLGSRMVELGDTFTTFGRNLLLKVTTPLALLGAKLFGLSSDAEETENLFAVSMGDMADDAEVWVQKTSKVLGLYETDVRKSVGTFHLMFTNMGIGEEAAYDMATSLTQLSADMTSFYNLRPGEAFEKLSSGMVGMSRPLRDIGIVIDEAAIKTYAYTSGLARQGEELTQEQEILARYQLVMILTDKAQGDLLRTWYSAENVKRRLQVEIKRTAEAYGDVLKPIIVEIMLQVEKFVLWLRGLSDEKKELIVKIGLVAFALGPLALAIGVVLKVVGTLITAVGVLGKALVFLTTNPIGAVVAAIGAVIAILVALWNKSEAFRDAMQAVWNFISDLVTGACTAIMTVVNGIVGAVKSAIEWVKKLLGLNREANETLPAAPPGSGIEPPAEMAAGGTVGRSGWSWVGERGVELLNLPRGAQVIPLDKMGGGTANIYVELDGRTIAKVIGQPLVDEIRLRTGLVTV
jgi:hypothetical protein